MLQFVIEIVYLKHGLAYLDESCLVRFDHRSG